MISNRIGRNDPCWCGSGIKYKKCHLGRELQKPIELWDAAKKFRDIYSEGICSAPSSFHDECSTKIAKAHTIPKSSSLNAIARDGHVYGFKFSLENIRKFEGKLRPELIGINKASTFSGFCETHDNSIFSPIEKSDFLNTEEQCFLLAYRAFSRECYTKTAMANLSGLRQSLDKGKSKEHQMEIQASNFFMRIGTQTALRDNLHHKRCFDGCLESDKYDQTRAIIFEFDSPPPVMTSGATDPDFDFNGNRIQNLMELDVIPDLISFTSFFDGKTGRIVFSWLEHCHNSCKILIESLLQKPKNELTTYLVQYMFKYFENSYIAPNWWDKTNQKTKDAIIDLLADSAKLESMPNSVSLSEAYLEIEFPKIVSIDLLNWSTNSVYNK